MNYEKMLKLVAFIPALLIGGWIIALDYDSSSPFFSLDSFLYLFVFVFLTITVYKLYNVISDGFWRFKVRRATRRLHNQN